MCDASEVLEKWNTVEVPANPGYMRVKYHKSNLDAKKPENDGISLAEALGLLGGKVVSVQF